MVNIQLAMDADVDDIARLRREAAEWLAEIGSDQWSSAGIDDAEFNRRVRSSIAEGETWVACDDRDKTLATIAIDDQSNPGLWTDEELEDSLIIHRMIKARSAPSGIGTALIQHAEQVAARRGAQWLRLDAWTTNTALHDYYRRAGFEHVRTVSGHHTCSAALFARRVPGAG